MGSRRTAVSGVSTEKVYTAAATWVDRALRSDDSLFTPGVPIWSRGWLGELRERFLDKPDDSKDSFEQKLSRQLAGSPPEVYQLMGEVLYVYFLIVGTRDSSTKELRINSVLQFSPTPVAIPPELAAALRLESVIRVSLSPAPSISGRISHRVC